MIYNSADDGKIYQTNPVYSKPSQFKPKGWTNTTCGYIREAKQWALCVLRNRDQMQRPYSWVFHLNLNEEIPFNEISPMWQKVSRKLKSKGIVALWVREANRLNKLHYHILVKNEISKDDLKNAIEFAMPPRSVVKWRKRVEPIRFRNWLCFYIFKAKVAGENDNGVFVKDKYRAKRLLFKPKMPFKKVGTIGDFWEHGKSKKKFWDEIKADQKQIGEGLERPNIERLCEHVYDLLGGCVSLIKIKRSYGMWPNSRGVQNWIEELLGEGWPDGDDRY